MKPLWPPHYTPPRQACASGIDVLDNVAHHFKITRADLVGPRRDKWVIYARTAAASILLARGNSTTTTGRILGKRDHKTAINLRRKIPRYTQECPLVGEVIAMLGGS